MRILATPGVREKEELARVAKAELGEDEVRLAADIATLRDWVKKSPHLKNIRTDDAFLTLFLRGCKFSLERTKEKLDFHFTVRGSLPSWFDQWDPKQESLAKILRLGAYLPLPGYDRKGRRVVLMRDGLVDPNDKVEDSFKMSTMVMTAAMEGDEQSEIMGIVLVMDMAGMTASHALRMNPVVAKKAMTVWQDAYPSRPKAMHFVNMPPVIESVFRMMQGLQKEKMRQRNHVHPKGDMSAVLADLGPEVLPPEYGGSGSSVDELTKYWIEQIEQKRDWLMAQSRYKTEEKLRPGKPKDHAELFGIEGSFRKLDID